VLGIRGMNSIATQLEDPLGDDPNDLPCHDFHRNFNIKLLMMLDPLLYKQTHVQTTAVMNLSELERRVNERHRTCQFLSLQQIMVKKHKTSKVRRSQFLLSAKTLSELSAEDDKKAGSKEAGSKEVTVSKFFPTGMFSRNRGSRQSNPDRFGSVVNSIGEESEEQFQVSRHRPSETKESECRLPQQPTELKKTQGSKAQDGETLEPLPVAAAPVLPQVPTDVVKQFMESFLLVVESYQNQRRLPGDEAREGSDGPVQHSEDRHAKCSHANFVDTDSSCGI